MAIGIEVQSCGPRGYVALRPQSQEKFMSRAIKHLLIGGLIIMTTGLPTATTANENDRKPTIVNPQNLYDPPPNGYSPAVIVPSGARDTGTPSSRERGGQYVSCLWVTSTLKKKKHAA